MDTNSSHRLFSTHELAQCAVQMARIRSAARWVPLIWLGTALLSLILSFVAYTEFELAFLMFDFVSGEESYLSAHILACSGLLMIIAFHILAIKAPRHIAVRSITVIASLLMPLYALGLGLLLAAMLFSDGLADLIASETGIFLGGAAASMESGLLEWVFAHLVNPTAVLIFSVAAGGLAIVNLFIAHHLIETIGKGVVSVHRRRARWKTARQDYATIQKAQAQYFKIAQERFDIAQQDEGVLASKITTETLLVIQEALAPHKVLLKQLEYDVEPSRLILPEHSPPNPKQLARDIAKIEAITANDIFRAINPYTTQEDMQ